MKSLHGLKGLLDKKRKAAEEEFGQQATAKRADIESVRQQRIQEQEQAELVQQQASCRGSRFTASRSHRFMLTQEHCTQADRQQANSQATTSERRDSLQVAPCAGCRAAWRPQAHIECLSCLQSRPSEQEQLPREEVVRRLRLLAKPVTLFGEVRGGLHRAGSAAWQPR